MALRDLVRWTPSETEVPVRRSEAPAAEVGWPFSGAIDEVFDRIVREFFQGAPFGASLAGFSPRIDVSESDDAVEVRAELPGVEEKDLEVSLTADALTLRGEKKLDREEKGKDFLRREQAYGSFHRVVPLPEEVDTEKVSAKFKNGVLTVTLPKAEESRRRRRRIAVEAA